MYGYKYLIIIVFAIVAVLLGAELLRRKGDSFFDSYTIAEKREIAIPLDRAKKTTNSVRTGLGLLYNKNKVVIGVEPNSIDSVFIEDRLYWGEKYFSSVSHDTLISFKNDSERTYLYMICTNGNKLSDIFNDYVGVMSNGKYNATKKIDDNYTHRSFALEYDRTDRILSVGSQKFAEVSSTDFEQLMRLFLDDFVMPRESLGALLDTLPYKGGFKNVKISLGDVDTNLHDKIKAMKGKYAYPDYYFRGKINKNGDIYDIKKENFDREESSDSKLIEGIVLKYLAKQQFLIAKFHHLPVNYELSIRATFVD